MQTSLTRFHKLLLGSAAGFAALATASAAQAGGLAVREQSTQFLGSAYAGNAAGGGALSSMFWNPAGLADAPDGLRSETNLTLLVPDTQFTVQPGTSPLLGGGAVGTTATQDRLALIGASYYSYRVSKDLVLGLALDAPFGLSNEVPANWAGRLQHRSASLFTLNFNPMASYQILPGVYIGAGAQLQYTKLRFSTANSASLTLLGGNPNADSTSLEVDDMAAGFNVGVLLKPLEGTTIGIGYRSAIAHNLNGSLDNVVMGGAPGFAAIPSIPATVDVDTPQMITASIRQSVTSYLRVMGTVEWTDWSIAGVKPIKSNGAPTGSALDLQWHDGWFFSAGGEYDYSDDLTLRGGVAYEISPIQNASERLAQVPDADRVWLSVGATYKVTDSMTVDFAYSHIFIDDATLNRLPSNAANVPLVARVESSADLVSVGLKMDIGSFLY